MSYHHPSAYRQGSGSSSGGNGGNAGPSLPSQFGYANASSSGGIGSGHGAHRDDDDERMLMRQAPYGSGPTHMNPGIQSGPPSGSYHSNLHQFQYPPYQQQPYHHGTPPSQQAMHSPSPRFGRHMYDSDTHYSGHTRQGSAGNEVSRSPSGSAHLPYPQARSRSSTPSGVAGVAMPYQLREPSADPGTPAGHSMSLTPPIASNAAARVAKACVPCSTKKRRCDGGKPECKVCTVLGTPCSYENRGLKRGPPKGFRAGPKESARAKLLRSLETTIRDLSQHIGTDDARDEIVRIGTERGIALAIKGEASSEAYFARRRGSKTDLDIAQRPSTAQKRVKRETSAPAEAPKPAGASSDDDSQEEEVLGISEHGNVRHFGSSSGIQLLQQRPAPPLRQIPSDNAITSPSRPGPHGGMPHRTSSSSSDWRSHSSPSASSKPPIPLPTVQPRIHGGSGTSSSFSPQASPAQKVTGYRQISREMNRKLFAQYWTGFHVFWPVLYKPGFDNISIDLLPSALDHALLNAIYAIGACVASPSLDVELESELGDAPPGEVFAQRAEAQLFQRMCPPLPTLSGTQTCFLLSLYNQGAGQLSKAYLYCSLAVSMAIDLGLHRHLRHHDSDLIERESRSRLIHCIHILSTVLAAEMGRPPMLRGKDIDVPLLSESEPDEFEKDSHGRTVYPLSCLNCSRRLFGIVERVLSQIHSFRRKAVLRRMGSDSTRKLVEEIHEELLTWRRTLPSHMQMPPVDGSYDYHREASPLPSFAAVHVWYHTAMLLLHRPFIPHDESSTSGEVIGDPNHQRCTFAAQELFELLSQLSRSSDVDRLSTDLAYVIFTAAVMFVFNSRLGQDGSAVHHDADWAPNGRVVPLNDDPVSIAKMVVSARKQFSMCKEWLKGLSERWPAASAHKQLLDGFASVGEGVVEHGAVGLGIASRPQTAQGGYGRGMQDFANNAHFDPQHPGFTHGFFAANMADGGADQRAFDLGLAPDEMYGKDQYDAANSGMPGTITNSSVLGMPTNPSQMSLNAYFEFAPNIFDMENVFWNETATRMTPYFGPIPDVPTDAGQTTALPQQQQSQADTRYSSAPPSQSLQQQQQSQQPVPYQPQAHQQPSASAPPPSGAAANLLSPRAQNVYINHQQRQRGHSDSVRRSSSLRHSSTDGMPDSAQTPATRASAGSFSEFGVQQREGHRPSFPETVASRNSSSSGLAMLAQQAQAMTSSGESNGNGQQGNAGMPSAPSMPMPPATSMGAPALPRSMQGGGGEGPRGSRALSSASGNGKRNKYGNHNQFVQTHSQQQQQHHAPTSAYHPAVMSQVQPSQQMPDRSGVPSNAPQQPHPSFSPFSLHQEPTAPEWGDVMSMLQLPPTFSQ